MVDLPIRREVLDHGSVELIDLMPRSGYLVAAIAEAARVSYAGGTKSFREDLALVQYLLYHRHWSPFDQVKLKFRVRCPLFVRSQWYRHWSWDYNEESARYSTVREEFHVPEVLRAQDSKNRQSSLGKVGRQEDLGQVILATEQASYSAYNLLLGDGVAREQARMVLPQAMYTTFIGTVSLRDLLVFLKQRCDTHAQWEIRQYAKIILGILAEIDPILTTTVENYFINAVELTRDQWNLVRKMLITYGPPAPRGWQGYGGLTKHEREGLDGLFG
jgi:thymidylate synthase (FAD)